MMFKPKSITLSIKLSSLQEFFENYGLYILLSIILVAGIICVMNIKSVK